MKDKIITGVGGFFISVKFASLTGGWKRQIQENSKNLVNVNLKGMMNRATLKIAATGKSYTRGIPE